MVVYLQVILDREHNPFYHSIQLNACSEKKAMCTQTQFLTQSGL